MLTKRITSLQHPLIKHLVCLRKEHAYREEKKRLLIPGKKLIEELASSVSIETLLIEEGRPLLESVQAHVRWLVPAQILKKVTGLQEPDPYAAECCFPSFSDLSSSRYLLILDRISDPGNLGTILRSALALSWDGVFFTPHTADPFNEKALRAAKGATFHLPLARGSWEELDRLVQNNPRTLYLADLKGVSIDQMTFSAPLGMILSNEAKGCSEEAKSRSTAVSIPMCGKMESLNVASAAAICLYTIRAL